MAEGVFDEEDLIRRTNELADFVSAIQKGTRPLVDGREGRNAVAIIEAIYRAAASGRTERP